MIIDVTKTESNVIHAGLACLKKEAKERLETSVTPLDADYWTGLIEHCDNLMTRIKIHKIP